MDVLQYSDVANHATDTLKGLDNHRKQAPQFCDFTIIVSDKVYPCHRSVLCLHSDYFRGMIGGKFAESNSNRAVLENVDLPSLETILDFIYSGEMKIDQKSVERLLETAMRFQFRKVIDVCVNYLRHQIDETNSLDIYNFGRCLAIPELAEAARQFTYERLDTVFDVTEVVKDMTTKDVERILQDELSQVRGEEQRIMSILKWINFDKSRRLKEMERLIQSIDWSRLSSRFVLQTLLYYPLVSSNKDTKKLIMTQVKKALEESSSASLNDRESAVTRSLYSRVRDQDQALGGGKRNCAEEVLLLIGGLTLGEAERGDFSQPNVMCYIPKTNQWVARTSWPERRLRGFSVARYYNDIIVSGGCDFVEMKRYKTNRSWKYDVTNDAWVQLHDMIYPRSFHASCQVKGELFVIGGAFSDKIDMEAYCSHTGTWRAMKECAPRVVRNFTAGHCNGKIILMGSGENRSTLVLQCYNPAVAQWTHFRSPNVPRHLSAPVCCTSQDGSCIYLVGDNTQKVFVFDPNANEWSRAEDMNNLHSNGGMTTMGKTIYVTGGHWEEDGYLDQMESYDIESRTWTSRGPLPHLWLYHVCSTVLQQNCSGSVPE